jgi:hypothetical protein
MRRFPIVLACALITLVAGNAAADVGLFTSYSTTTTRSPGALTFDVSVGTTGLVTTSPTDYVYVLGGIIPTTASTFIGTGTLTALPRTGSGATAFSGSFSVTGISDTTNYKWITLTIGDVGGTGFGPTAFFYVYYFLYYGCLPLSPPYSAFLTTPGSPGVPQPLLCTTTPTADGPLYDFIHSNVNTFHSTANWWATNGVSTFPVLAHGVATGLALIAAIPTMASWGLMVLGALIALTGFIVLRRI